MKTCVLSYNKVTNQVTVTADTIVFFHQLAQEELERHEERVKTFRTYLTSHPGDGMATLALDVNLLVAERLKTVLRELEEVRTHVKEQEQKEGREEP